MRGVWKVVGSALNWLDSPVASCRGLPLRKKGPAGLESRRMREWESWVGDSLASERA